MKAFPLLAIALLLVWPLTGCEDRSGTGAASAQKDDHGHGHGHDHGHGDESREALGLEKAGPYEVAPIQLGKVKPGGQLAFDIEILGQGQPKPKAVRLWIGGPSAEGVTKALAESEKDNVYHVDLPLPAATSAETKLWVEVEPPQGTPVTASFALK